MDTEKFIGSLAEKGISLTPSQLQQFTTYYEMLICWNERMNLTAITEKEDVYLKHFYDSLTATFYYNFDQNIRICDVGAGAGFPSLPIKIAFPKIHVTIVDSLNKRIHFLETLAQQLKLENVRFIHDRAETFGHLSEHRESYDVVTARAVARMSVLSELCLPLVRKGGVFIAMKGAGGNEELQASKKAVSLLGGELKESYSFTLPYEDSERNIYMIEKLKSTPKKYPRKPGTPNRNPIQ